MLQFETIAGTTKVDMFSDIDILYARTDTELVQDESEYQEGRHQLLLEPTERSGYYRLVVEPTYIEATIRFY